MIWKLYTEDAKCPQPPIIVFRGGSFAYCRGIPVNCLLESLVQISKIMLPSITSLINMKTDYGDWCFLHYTTEEWEGIWLKLTKWCLENMILPSQHSCPRQMKVMPVFPPEDIVWNCMYNEQRRVIDITTLVYGSPTSGTDYQHK